MSIFGDLQRDYYQELDAAKKEHQRTLQQILENLDNMFQNILEMYRNCQEIDTLCQQSIENSRKKQINAQRILNKLIDDPATVLEHYPQKSAEDVERMCKSCIEKMNNDEAYAQKYRVEEWRKLSNDVIDSITRIKDSLRSYSYPESYKHELQEMIEMHKKIGGDIQNRLSELEIEAAGQKGEEEVEYAIKWMQPLGYRSITKDCLSKHGNVCILIKNRDYIDEDQEIDHILVGKNGVFLIETKNYSGTIIVNTGGDWIQEKGDIRKGIKNPVQQCNRHSGIIRSILGSVPIVSIICIANTGVIIEGRENCNIPIIKVELLQDFIERTQIEQELSESEITRIVKQINSHKTSEPLK